MLSGLALVGEQTVDYILDRCFGVILAGPLVILKGFVDLMVIHYTNFPD